MEKFSCLFSFPINYHFNLVDIITCLILLFTAIISYKVYSIQKEQTQKQRLPYLKISSVISEKSTPDIHSVYNNLYCRIYNGETKNSIVNLDLDGNMKVFSANDEQIEPGFIDEIKSHIGKNDVYLTYFGSKPFLVVNHASNPDNFIIDHCTVKISLHNYGATIDSISIESLTVYYKSDLNIEPFTFDGNPTLKMTLSFDENNDFSLFLDEVTTNLNNSLCEMAPSIYEHLPLSYDLLKTHIGENQLNYDKLVYCIIDK